MLYQLSYSGVSEPVRAATERLIRRAADLVQAFRDGLWTASHGARTRPALDAGADLRHSSRMIDDERATAGTEPEMLDLRGLKCPLPVLHTRRALSRLAPGAVLVVRCTDPLAGLDLPNLVRETRDLLLEAARDGCGMRFTIRRVGP